MAKKKANLTVNPNRKRYSQRQVDARRIGVWEMLCCGESIDNIATHYDVSYRTISRDIKFWQDKLGQGAEDLKVPENAAIDIGTTARRLEKMYEDALVEFMAASTASSKVRFMQVGIQSLVMRHKILADAGFLPRIGHEKEVAQKVSISFEARFGKDAPEAVFDDPKSRRRVMEAAFSLMKAGMIDSIDDVDETTLPALPAPQEIIRDVDAEEVA